MKITGQNVIETIYNHANWSDEVKAKKIDSLFDRYKKDSVSNDFSNYSYSHARWLYKTGRIEKAIQLLREGIKRHKSDAYSLQKKYYRLRLYLEKDNQPQASLQAWREIIKLGGNNKYIARAHYTIGKEEVRKGNYFLAKDHFEQAEKMFYQLKNYEYVIRNYNRSFEAYESINDETSKQKLLLNLYQADSLGKVYKDIDYLTRYNTKRLFGLFYAKYQNRDTLLGRLKFDEALKMATQARDTFGIAETYRDIGLLYDTSNPKKSISFLKKSLDYSQQDWEKVIIYSNLGLNNAHLKKIDLSLEQQFKALDYLTGLDFQQELQENKGSILNRYYNDFNFWKILSNIADTYLVAYDHSQDSLDLKRSIDFFILTDELIDVFHSRIDETDSKLIWRKRASEIYSRGLRACYLAKDYSTAFRFMEKNKSLLLYEENLERKRRSSLQIPQKILQKEYALKRQVLQDKGNLQLQQKLAAFQDSLTLAFPDYILSIEKYEPPSVEDLQKELEHQDVLLEYHVTQDSGFGIAPNTNKIYGLFISSEHVDFFEILDTNSLEKNVSSYLHKNQSPLIHTEEKQSYQKLTFDLYDKLFPDTIRDKMIGKKLWIIPDHFLTKVSFESLSTSMEESTENYLIYKNQVNYQYSYTFHNTIQDNKDERNSQTSLSSFAPVEFQESELAKLDYSLDEVESIHNIFGGKMYEKGHATKKAFYEALQTSAIVHLATHANVSDTLTPWIAFTDGKLFTDELSLRPNHTNTVVLSACNTSLGEIKIGEGTMSLSRGFFYGNTKTSISSLWKTDDRATAYIMNRFYTNLNEGMSKGAALHKAKRSYLEDHFGLERSPHYWSSFILIGDADPLPHESSLWKYFLAAQLLLLVLLYFKRKKASKKEA